MMAATMVRGVVPADALRHPRAALRVIDAHLPADHITGRCRGCGEMSPCPQLDLGYAALSGTGVLPQREPGLTLVETATFNGFDPVATG